MQQKPIINQRYEFTYYDGREIQTCSISQQEIKEINRRNYDFFMSQSQAIWGYRNADGRWIEHKIDWPGLGNTCIKIIQAAQLNTGSFQTPADIAYLAGIDSLAENNNLSARWLALRKAHGESFSKPRFWLSRRAGGLAVAWNPKHSWAWLEKIPAACLQPTNSPKTEE